MSKTRRNHKWFDDEENFHMGHNRAKKVNKKPTTKLEERQAQRKQVIAEKTQILNTRLREDDE
jgi:hypothetical protein